MKSEGIPTFQAPGRVGGRRRAAVRGRAGSRYRSRTRTPIGPARCIESAKDDLETHDE